MAASILILLAILPGCRDASEQEPIGPVRKSASSPQLIDDFREIIDKDLFNGVISSKDKLLKADYISSHDGEPSVSEYKGIMMDKYGEELLSFSCEPEVTGRRPMYIYSHDIYTSTAAFDGIISPDHETLLATDDGGILYIYGWTTAAQLEYSDLMCNYKIVKWDSEGEVRFNQPLKFQRVCALRACHEKDGKYYLFGTILREGSSLEELQTEGYAVVLDSAGNVIKSERIDCGASAELVLAEPGKDGFFLLLDSSSSGEDVTCFVDFDLNASAIKEANGKPGAFIGTKDGKPVYRNDEILNDYVDEEPVLLVDYGDFYLVRSKRLVSASGILAQNGILGRSKSYEIIYSAYDDDGVHLFREKSPNTVSELDEPGHRLWDAKNVPIVLYKNRIPFSESWEYE